jgi:hypothetical protein
MNDMKKFLGKFNYLRQFIFNLSGKISAFVTILHLKNKADFTWEGGGAERQLACDEIKKYLSLLPVMKAPKAGILFWLYITAEDSIIGIVLTQVTDGNEHIITYLSCLLIDAKTRYSFIEKLCLS